MRLSRLALAGMALATTLSNATLGADASQPLTPPATANDLRTALDSARASLHSQNAMTPVNELLKALALAGTDVRVKRDKTADQTVITMRVTIAGQIHVATSANADCFQATVDCAAEVLKAFEAAAKDAQDVKEEPVKPAKKFPGDKAA